MHFVYGSHLVVEYFAYSSHLLVECVAYSSSAVVLNVYSYTTNGREVILRPLAI